MNIIYIEQEIADHPRTREILHRFPGATKYLVRVIRRFFNKKAQNFRLQKKQPALILANKF